MDFISLEKEYGPFLYSSRDIEFTHGKGAILYTSDNKEYLDFIAGHGVGNIGHAHPKVVKAIQDQAAKVIVLHSSFPHSERAELYKKLADITPKELTNSFLSNSGTESVETAIKLAVVSHRNIKKPHFIAMKRGFHGRTLGSLAFTFGSTYRNAFQSCIGIDVSFASFGDIDSVRSLINENTVGIITEIIQGEGGIYPAPTNFPKELRELCDEKNITMIVDEVQSGVGRSGRFFAFEHYGIVPDVVCVAKAIAGGVPMGVTIARKEFFEAFKKGEHASTFGGNPLACAAANATIDAIYEEKLMENATFMGNYIEKRIAEWCEEEKISNLIKEHRGIGLMRGIQLKTKAGDFLKGCYDKQLLLLNAGMTVIRMLPPLVINQNQMDNALSIMYDVINQKSSQ